MEIDDLELYLLNIKKLKDRAIEIKNEWIMGAKQELEAYENINI